MRSEGRTRLPPRRGAVLPVLVLLVTTLAGCGVPSTSPPAAPVTTASVAPYASPTASAAVQSLPLASAAAASPSGADLVVDPRLLDVLPKTIDGVELAPDPGTAAQLADNVSLATSAEAIAVALAVDPGSSTPGGDLAIVSVIRLRPGVFSDAWFETWRSEYDAAACEVAGGLVGKATQATIGGRSAYVGTCAGDAHTYHVQLTDPPRIISITSAGSGGFGELVLAGLRE